MLLKIAIKNGFIKCKKFVKIYKSVLDNVLKNELQQIINIFLYI